MNPTALMPITLTIFTGTMLTMISSHWLLIWMGLEMNMLAIIPVLAKKTNPRSTEAATKYFLTQATASMLLMMTIVINAMHTGQWNITNTHNPLTSLTIIIALTMKLGMTPFHFWVPEVTQGVTLMAGMLLLTWQKLAPISIMMQIYPSMNMNILLAFALLSVLVGGWGGLNQTQLRKILAYSSIAHMGWMMAVLMFCPSLTILNLLIYLMLTITLFTMLNINTNTTTLTLSILWNKSPTITLMILTSLLSLGGLPPLTGFLPKWVIVQELTKNNNIIMATIMVIMALLNLYFYMRLIYSTSLTMFPTFNNMKMKWQFQTTKYTLFLPPLIALSTLSLPLSPILLTLS
ncbi:NADH dehydrogenase subunit 2 (mitochondrion) [Propithecus coquereli]|uniref:NADH-ubiquinone oxidoreductase chain 2 n=1 Tax=Propithecus coquereli TaxID=379532 RepID=B3XXA7_PROCO|nr:NADH dehydrogenase subunit 2 [Propithecus coquereli]UTE83242.1 NADH dehydrogenase subunit 2 [Propithecus coquereli]UTE83255.1 NADH dehydrogenase subunit 2 [Propithecus coquereli]UTE83281.1 NADH dehydrogenase subunit 2 [Propithecus coquereli]UTE83294.1 NADH dehydrogenase subunit 2 [Propithecus coquereli]BAG55322.1 NADH dehydrogenase subunit 2 [Propithecus coquereli]